MNFYARPDFIPASIVGAPLDFLWEGAQAHIGPVEVVTPLMKRLGQGTGLAQVALCAGVLLWLTWRLREATEVDHNLELAEAAFAYCVDWRYIDVDAGPKGKAPEQPPALSAAKKVNSLMRRALNHETYWNSFYQPVGETFHSANIVNHILPRATQRVFEGWLLALADRVKTHFPRPSIEYREYSTFESEVAYDEFVAPMRGVAPPPQILDPSFAYEPQQRDRLLSEFLAELDPKRNRYLRTPEAMLELGFTGTPYKLG